MTDSSTSAADRFSILTGGYGYRLISKVWDEVERRTGFTIAHIPEPSLFPSDNRRDRPSQRGLFYLFDAPQRSLPKGDIEFLTRLEGDSGPTIHNIILGDRLLSGLPYDEAINYLSLAAKRFHEILTEVKPDVVLSGYDGFQSTMLMLVCRASNVPWFALTYLPFPKSMTGFSPMNVGNRTRAFGSVDSAIVSEEADSALSAFEGGLLAPFVPASENSFANIFKLMPLRLRNASSNLKSLIRGRRDRYTRRSLLKSAADYARRRRNQIANKKLPMLHEPPSAPFAFFGLHMQPEMGIDVWAPFFANQPYVIECAARALPPSHKLLVKLHRIDSDNWSNSELSQIRALPGVELVSPLANTRAFVRAADIVFSIQGTIAFEAALLGRPVVTFGETMYEDMPMVTRVTDLVALPSLVRRKLKEGPPSSLEKRQGLETLLARFRKGLFNNWNEDPTDTQLNDFCQHLSALKHFVLTNHSTGTRSVPVY